MVTSTMKPFFNAVIRYFIFWILFAMLGKVFFLCYFYEQSWKLGGADFIRIFAYGLRMDVSMAAYICALPCVFIVIQLWIKKRVSIWWIRIYTWTILFISSLICIVNLNIYREWDTLFSYKAIDIFLDAPHLAIASATSSPLLLSCILLIVFIFMGAGLMYVLRIFHGKLPRGMAWYKKGGISLGMFLLVFVLIRGGWGLTPLNASMVYFSTSSFPNHAATNVSWYLMHDVVHAKGQNRNQYTVMSKQEEAKQLAPLFDTVSAPSMSLLKMKRPNIVIVILESFTADLVAALGGEQGIAPHMDELIQKGVLFDQIYATGDRTDKGIIGILSAFPSQSSQSIIKHIDKQEKLPSMVGDFAQRGYATSFYYGGESEFYNFKGYMLSHGCKQIVDQYQFPLNEVTSKWGVFDHLTFDRQLHDLSKQREPFFSTLLTLNNHEPFDLPETHRFGTTDLPALFKSTAYYTDSVLYDYLNKAKKESWYKHTLFVIVADHGHRLPLEKWESNHPNRYRIPLIFFGDVIKDAYRGKRIDKLGSQVDLVATLYRQLGMESNRYVWSRDLLDANTKPFAFFSWADGWGVLNDHCAVSFDQVGKVISYTAGNHSSCKNELFRTGQAYMQGVYQQFLNY